MTELKKKPFIYLWAKFRFTQKDGTQKSWDGQVGKSKQKSWDGFRLPDSSSINVFEFDAFHRSVGGGGSQTFVDDSIFFYYYSGGLVKMSVVSIKTQT